MGRLQRVQRGAMSIIRGVQNLLCEGGVTELFSPWRREGLGALHHNIAVLREQLQSGWSVSLLHVERRRINKYKLHQETFHLDTRK